MRCSTDWCGLVKYTGGLLILVFQSVQHSLTNTHTHTAAQLGEDDGDDGDDEG